MGFLLGGTPHTVNVHYIIALEEPFARSGGSQCDNADDGDQYGFRGLSSYIVPSTTRTLRAAEG